MFNLDTRPSVLLMYTRTFRRTPQGEQLTLKIPPTQRILCLTKLEPDQNDFFNRTVLGLSSY